MSEDQVQSLEDSLEIFIPDSLQDFLTTDSASCRCEYYLSTAKHPEQSPIQMYGTELANRMALSSIYGGANLCNSEHFAFWNSDDLKSVFAFDAELNDYWQNAFIFAAVGNGDFLGLDCRENFIDPAVIYLDHEGEIRPPISNSLNDFLFNWQRLGYIGPAIWRIEKYFDSHGLLNWEIACDDQIKHERWTI